MASMSESSETAPATRRICGVQTHVAFADTATNLARMLQWLEHPETQGMDLVVFPECMLSGYCFSSLAEALPHAESIPGPATQAIQRACEARSLHVAFGMLERDSQGRIYNSCPLVGPAGVVANYRKVHLPYLGIDRFATPGDLGFQACDADAMRIGIHICYDGSFPESSRCLALDGADLLILPTNWPPGAETFARYLPNARALENNVYFMSVNRVGTERGFRFIGNSKICDTNGVPMAEASHEDEAILQAEIDLARARNKRLVRVPKEHIIDRWADRRPETYGRIVLPHHLRRDIQ
jgi:predicted amidohydrolase